MSVKIKCPACKEIFKIEEDQEGKKVMCPLCIKKFIANSPGKAQQKPLPKKIKDLKSKSNTGIKAPVYPSVKQLKKYERLKLIFFGLFFTSFAFNISSSFFLKKGLLGRISGFLAGMCILVSIPGFIYAMSKAKLLPEMPKENEYVEGRLYRAKSNEYTALFFITTILVFLITYRAYLDLDSSIQSFIALMFFIAYYCHSRVLVWYLTRKIDKSEHTGNDQV